MEQKKIEHITLNLIVFGTIAIIGILARQTVLLYGWDEFSSYLILMVCSIIMGAIYLNLQMVFRQFLSPTIERYFMRFESYRNKAVVVEAPAANSELAGSSINSEPIISEPEPEIEIPSDTIAEVSLPSIPESNEDVAELSKEESLGRRGHFYFVVTSELLSFSGRFRRSVRWSEPSMRCGREWRQRQ